MHVAEIAGRLAVCVAVATLGPIAGAKADDAAVVRLDQALAAAEAAGGATSPKLLPVLARLAEAQSRGGALDKAAALRRRGLDIAVSAFGCGAPQAAEAMAALGLIDLDRRRFLDAEPLLLAAIGALRGRRSERAVSAEVLAGLARIAVARGDAKPALAWARRAVAASASGAALRALGAALTAARRFDAAKAALEKAVAWDRARYGADAVSTARSLSQLANLHLRAGQPRVALPLIEEAGAIDQARLGPTHPFIADDLHDLGLAYEALGRRDMARKTFGAAIRLLDRGGNGETTRAAYAEIELSRLYRQAGDAAAADAAFKGARRILDKAEAEEKKRERKA